MSWTSLVVMVTIVTSQVLGYCDLPPSLWCSSTDVAQRCGVHKQCQEWSQGSAMATPVNLTLYYESLCPDCRNFFQGQLYNMWTALGDDRLKVLNLELVPYGNAREQKIGDKWVFQCQHGNLECVGNMIDTCAINLLKNISVYFPYIHCMEVSDLSPTDAAKKCAIDQGIDVAPILNCADSDMGDQLEHMMAQKTDALNPPHKYVPWVTLNGVHTEKIEKEAEEDLLKLICDTYQGPKPVACDQRKSRGCQRF